MKKLIDIINTDSEPNIFEIKISKQNARSIESSDQPIKYYDYNF
jgi:hypothetical protein